MKTLIPLFTALLAFNAFGHEVVLPQESDVPNKVEITIKKTKPNDF